MTDDDYIHVRVPELPDWHTDRPVGFVTEKPRLIVVEQPRYRTRDAKKATA